jgi:glycosyltransferase involved in cell wall biosynthesis
MNAATPLISVVIPTYNHARYLGRALQSVLDQTYVNWEAIVIDNHSTDNTDEVVANLADYRITYLKIHNNGVIAASRNAGIRAAKGEWIAFLDSDDWWAEDKLTACHGSINNKVDFIYHDLEITSDQTPLPRRKSTRCWQVKSPVLVDLLTKGNAIATSSVVVRAELLKQLKGMCELPSMVAAEDYNTWLRIAELTNNFVYLPRILGYYLIHDLGLSKKDMSFPTRCATKQFLSFLSNHQKRKLNANLRYVSGRFKFKAGDFKGAKKDLYFALRYSGFYTRTKIFFMLIMMLRFKDAHIW